MALLASCQVLGGVSCVLAGLLRPPWVLPLSLAGKFCSSVVFLIVYLYTAEIYPTQLRGCGLALTATMARIGDFIAPYIAGGWAHLHSSARKGQKLNQTTAVAGLGVRNSSLPFLIFGGAAIAGGCLAVLLPETRGVKLPETVAEVEEIVRRGTCTTSWLPGARRRRGRSQEDTGETRL